MSATGTLAWGTYYPNAPLFGPVIGRGSRVGRELYLTFDDGPNPGATALILETLQKERVPAAFFMVGAHVRRHPELARQIAAAGHEIGNHTDHHRKLHLRGPGAIRAELDGAHRAISETTGCPPRSFRAPHGFRNPFLRREIQRLGYRMFGWTFGVWDSDPIGGEEIRRRVRARLRPGSIILLHDGDGYDPAGDRRPTAAALPGIIADARDAGYVFRPLGGLSGAVPG
ncbi:MAG TPA: polysaccharide deacetylase family protein [Gemmatimonadales bacterium]|nr:polysaccharide deacetylase family protein [Gemmatimonadales bacterium]